MGRKEPFFALIILFFDDNRDDAMIISNGINDIVNKPTAAALGTFDGIHAGHRLVIDNMISYAEENKLSKLVYSISGNKNVPQLMTFDMKADILKNMGIEYLINPDFESIRNCSPEQFVGEYLHNKLNVQAVFCGENYHFGKNAAANAKDMQDLCKQYDMDCIIIPAVMADDMIISSSLIREYIENGNIQMANNMLGRPFGIELTVSTGNRIGRILGTPTINQPCPPELIHPKHGVYASFVKVDGEIHPAVTNFGVKPTVSDKQAPLYETWIMDFSGDLYGKIIPVWLLAFLRSEQKFDGLDNLKAQIYIDGENSRKIYEQYKMSK